MSHPDEIRRLAFELGMGHPCEVELLAGGRINENWHVRTNTLEFVLRRYPTTRRRRQVEFEVSLHDHLIASGCRVPAIISPPSGNRITSRDGRVIVLLEYLSAVPLTLAQARSLSPRRLHALLDPVDEALDRFEPPFSPIPETRVFEARLPSLFAQLGDAPRQRTQIEHTYREMVDWEAHASLPCRAVHADMHPGNVLEGVGGELEQGDLWLVDFDDAHVSHRALDWVLPALEFSLNDDASVDEGRYSELLTILGTRATGAERAAFPVLRRLLLLKFAVSLADCGEPLVQNPYFVHLVRSTPGARA